MTLAATLNQPEADQQDEFTFLEPIYNTKVPALCRHNPCGTVFKISPNHLRTRGYFCRNCENFAHDFHATPTVDNPIMKVHCPHHHRFRVFKKDYYKKVAGEIKCPICQQLKLWDPVFKNAQVQFVFHFLGGHVY